MADAVLGLLLENLNSLIQSEFGLLHGVQEEAEKLSLTLSTVQAVIEDAETKQHTDKAIAVWLRRLKDTAYDAEDVLDEWMTEVRQSEFESSQVTNSWFHFNQPVFRHKIAKKIKKVHADFDFIAGEISKFDLKIRVVERVALLDPNRETSSLLVEPEQVYGRDEDQRKIVDMLISNASSRNISVLPILGVGGLGKTTLAQLVCNDERVSKCFGARMWVCVAEDFDVKRVTTLIIECLSACGAEGSSLLITTRLETVALLMGTLPLYRLSFLSDDECWAIFKGRACGMDDEDLSADLVETGKQIVKKCGGVPLATRALGTLLRFKRDVNEWESIRGSEIWELPEEKGGAILGALRLSYNHLPTELRQCFSYCSLYPKDHELIKTELIQLWMANGFVRGIGRMDLEDMGNYIFNELLRGSFFQDPEKDYTGGIVKCKMHDLMHDLACSLTKTECCTVKKIDTVPKGMRHLSLVVSSSKPSSNPYKSLCKLNKSLRTHFLHTDKSSINPPPLHMNFSKLKYLRVLKLRETGVRQVPNSIGGMKCLRYLNLSGNYSLGFLPDSICSLINLQTLNLDGCQNLTRLPKHMRKLRSLRHLDIGGCTKLSKMPIKMGQMVGLSTLSNFIVGEKKGEQINELNGLKHLSGELLLEKLELVNNSTEATEADLASKPNLSSLLLSWGRRDGSIHRDEMQEEERKKSERVLECLQPHVNLNQNLTIHWYQGVVLPSWMTLLRNLREIQLFECWNCETLPPLGQLSRLVLLRISRMKSLKCIGVEFYGEVGGHLKGFPSLEYLLLDYMANLEEWEFPSSLLKDDENGKALLFPCLRKLWLMDCPKLETPSIFLPTSCCCLRNLNSLNIGGVSFLMQSLSNLTALETLRISEKESILSGEIEYLTALKSLVIHSCKELISLPAEGLQKLTSLNLKSLSIYSCDSIKSLPAMGRMIQEGMMMKTSCCSLVVLIIQYCSSLTSVSEGLRFLTSLETLNISFCKEFELKREDFQHLTCLRHLDLTDLPKLTSVPDVQNLTALQSLAFGSDKNLRMLPEGLQHLTSLQSLFLIVILIYINDSRELTGPTFPTFQILTSSFISICSSVPSHCLKIVFTRTTYNQHHPNSLSILPDESKTIDIHIYHCVPYLIYEFYCLRSANPVYYIYEYDCRFALNRSHLIGAISWTRNAVGTPDYDQNY
ncbi:hypothetical protein AQUCO_01700591v1 [Aquilegia coerulea]|uniref:NB-ARC domain-containing protein n=1 Tax=Aquilegia coerulea TaxID=218851 RepID=A0A2G5DNQ2_AQUCA|nr:hypothetical protein AQUCO_01700591v1 [Aquilegia coerulea]